MASLFDDIESQPSRAYHVVSGYQRELPPPPSESEPRRRRSERRFEN